MAPGTARDRARGAGGPLKRLRAVLLAGGTGSRLRPYTFVIPKPLVPVDGRPILSIVLDQLARAGFGEATLCLGHHAGYLKAWLESAEGLPANLRLSHVVEASPLGTAGAVRQVPRPAESFLVMNGDILTNLDFAGFLRAHDASGAALTIATTRRESRVDLGILKFGADDRLLEYVEKPSHDYWVSMGIYAWHPRVLDRIQAGERVDFPDLVRRLLAAGETVRVHRSEDYWLDIGRPDDYERAEKEYRAVFTS